MTIIQTWLEKEKEKSVFLKSFKNFEWQNVMKFRQIMQEISSIQTQQLKTTFFTSSRIKFTYT